MSLGSSSSNAGLERNGEATIRCNVVCSLPFPGEKREHTEQPVVRKDHDDTIHEYNE